MSLTNLCSCALIKDHKMRQIINDLSLLFFKSYEFGIIFLRTNILIYVFKNLRLYPLSPVPNPPFTPATLFVGGILKVNRLWMEIFNVGGLQMWLFCGLLARCKQFQEQEYNYLYFYMWLAGEIVVNRGAVVGNRSGVVVGSWHIVMSRSGVGINRSTVVALSYWNIAGVVTQFSTVVITTVHD